MIDREIETLQANVIVHRDRITAMDIKREKLERKRREDEKAAFIVELKKALPRRQAAVVHLDAALKEAAGAFAELAAADDAIFESWPEVMPSAQLLAICEPCGSSPCHRPGSRAPRWPV